MNRLVLFGLIVLGIEVKSFSQTKTWDGGGSDNNFSTANNWDDDLAPVAGNGENYIFDATSTKSCIVNVVSIDATSFSVMPGYNSVINMGTGSHLLGGNLVINSGTVISTSADLGFYGSTGLFQLGASGTFSNNGGTIYLAHPQNQTFTFAGNIALSLLDLQAGPGTSQRNVDFGTNLVVDDIQFSSTRVLAFQGTVHVKNSLDLSGSFFTGTPTGNTGTFIFDGASATILGGSTNTKNSLPNVEINTTGNFSFSGHVNVRGNWTGTQGVLTAGTSTVNMYGSSAAISGSAVAFSNLVIQPSATVTLPASEVLIGGTLTRTGTLNFQSATVLGLNGAGSQSIGGSAITLGGIHAYSGSRTITMSTGITILDFLQVDANVTFASAGNVTLAANSATQVARLAELGSGASVTGNVTVETFLPGGATGWANLGVRGVTGQTVADWDTYVSSGGANGIPMTCTLCSFQPSVLSTPFTSIQGWDEPTDGYIDLTATSPMNPGVGRWVYVGDGQTTTNNLKLINTGTLAQNLITVPVTSSGAGTGPLGEYYNLVANPYPCPISTSALFANNNNMLSQFNNAVYVWRADLSSGSGAYTSYVNGVSDGQGQTDVIPGGQGFYVEYAPLLSTPLEFTESMKISTNAPVLKSANVGQIVKLTLAGANENNTTVFRIHPEATPFYDRKFDAHKLFTTPGYVGYPGPYSNYTTLSSKDAFDIDYAIQSLPPLTQSVSIPLLAKVSTSGTYSISISERIDFNTCVVLIDKLDNSYHDLGVAPYVFTISDTTSAPRFELVLCKDESYTPVGLAKENLNNTHILINQDQEGAYVRTAFPQNTKATISVYNLVGQKLTNDIEVEGTVTETRLDLNLHNQVVFIRVLTNKETCTKKIVLH